jgi:hypothetical protein
MARSTALGNGSNHNHYQYNPSTEPLGRIKGSKSRDKHHSPSKDRRRANTNKLRACLLLLCILLITFLCICQVLFWTRRQDLESAVETALLFAQKGVQYAEQQVEHAMMSNKDDSSIIQRHDRNENRSIRVYGALEPSPTTIITAYYQLESKYPTENYQRWMRNFLSMQDAMVIFCDESYVGHMQHLRSHATNKTVIISMPLHHTPMAQDYSRHFWERQFHLDKEQERHHSYRLFWIWLSKTWFVVEAMERNYFHSEIFLWSDIGCFRLPKFRHKTLIQHVDLVPRHSILQMAHHDPKPPPKPIWNDKLYKGGKHFYHSGSQAIGYKDTWREFHQAFLATVEEFNKKHLFLGEDQMVLQSTCLLNPNLCAYVPYKQVLPDNHYFGLRRVLYTGGNYTYWRPPGATVRKEHVSSKTVTLE